MALLALIAWRVTAGDPADGAASVASDGGRGGDGDARRGSSGAVARGDAGGGARRAGSGAPEAEDAEARASRLAAAEKAHLRRLDALGRVMSGASPAAGASPSSPDARASSNGGGGQAAAPAPAPLPAGWMLDVGTPDARPYLVDGWYSDEREGDGRTMVWSRGARSRIGFTMAAAAVPHQMKFIARPVYAEPARMIQVFINGAPAGTLEYSTTAWQVRELRIPAGLLIDGENVLELAYDVVVAPADVTPQAQDTRKLALCVDRVSLEPAL